MTHALTLAHSEPLEGLHRFQPSRDLAGVVKLLQLVFRDELEAPDLAWLRELGALTAGSGWAKFLLSVMPPERGLFGGFVWYEDGRVAGNVSLLRISAAHWVIANVATHPMYRRRGIARTLMTASIDATRDAGGKVVGLQVRTHNDAARQLYDELGFARLGSSTTYRGAPSAVAAGHGSALFGWTSPPLPPTPKGTRLVAWRPAPDRDVRRLLSRVGALDGPWPPGPLRQAINRRGLGGRIDDFVRGRERLGWRVIDSDERAVAVAVALRDTLEAGVTAEMAVAPEHRGGVESALLAAIGREVDDRHTLTIDVPEEEAGASAAVDHAGLEPVRTLDRYGLNL